MTHDVTRALNTRSRLRRMDETHVVCFHFTAQKP
jgi:hypothetical protein